ncbi:hypothetical protein GCM10009661_26910 [Catellatospora chokoriensis]|uniref:UDP-N-acetylmuramate--L-alanine ligase n=2 Tax=Catellatospora chokoriensis TaxID=310353 RepID=A0A8J3JMN9_9ACTN|nr:hypothetical protein Cch02nite_11060 [Catellatospora chokoriensis]
MKSVAALAFQLGLTVSGSDPQPSPITRRLQELGVDFRHGPTARNINSDLDAVVITTIIPPDDPEVVAAHRLGIPVLHRSQALARLVEGRPSIGVLGSAGKGTTAGALTSILRGAGLDAGFYLGWHLRSEGSSVQSGRDWMVLEIDESDGSMRNFTPDLVVITNLYREHLDYYGDLDTMIDEFAAWLIGNERLRAAVLNADDPGSRRLARRLIDSGITVVGYGFGPAARHRGSELRTTLTDLTLRWEAPAQPAVDLRARVGMPYNGHNLLAAAAAAHWLGIATETVRAALVDYEGIAGRLEVLVGESGVTFVGAYAAVPESLDAVVDQILACHAPDDVLMVFQPNRSWRLSSFLAPYVAALRRMNHVVITDLAETFVGQTERHRRLEAERSASDARSEADLVAALGPHARCVPAERLEAVLREETRRFRVIAVVAGGEAFLDRMARAVTGAALPAER